MKILVVPLSATGHVNPTLGLASKLKDSGHEVVYPVDTSKVGLFQKYGFQEVIFNECASVEESNAKTSWEETFESAMATFRLKSTEQYPLIVDIYRRTLLGVQHANEQMKEIVKSVKPDVIVLDAAGPYPFLLKAGIPIVILCPMGPLCILENERLPPPWTGLPLAEGPEDNWRHHRTVRDNYVRGIWSEMNDCFVKNGAPPLSRDNFFYSSTNLNLIVYPKPLLDRYLKQASTSLNPNWMCLDHSIRQTSEVFEIPEKLRNGTGKLIYVSMGTLGVADTELIRRLLDELSRSRHRFIVNTGMYHNLYKLPQNVYGASFLPQLAILPIVDLVITHGGNNSFIETLYFGRPLIVTPIFLDQYDNARMVVEAEIGVQFLPYEEPMSTLLDKIDLVLNDDKMRQNVLEISAQMRRSDALERAVKQIETLSKSYNEPLVRSPPDPLSNVPCEAI